MGIAQDAPESTGSTQGEAQAASDEGPDSIAWSDNSECKLLGPFALVVQGALGLLALVSLVFKRWRERPRRPLKIWFFDASKQVFGSALLHVFNVLLSLLSSGAVELTTQGQLGAAGKSSPDANPCSFYLINIAVDTTLGIPILVLLLKVLHQAALVTPLANPPESIKSGYYGEPPKATWWLKQALIYSIGLLLMKLCVFFLFGVLPWIVWVGNWALRWTEGSEALQIAFVMFVFPLIMSKSCLLFSRMALLTTRMQTAYNTTLSTCSSRIGPRNHTGMKPCLLMTVMTRSRTLTVGYWRMNQMTSTRRILRLAMAAMRATSTALQEQREARLRARRSADGDTIRGWSCSNSVDASPRTCSRLAQARCMGRRGQKYSVVS